MRGNTPAQAKKIIKRNKIIIRLLKKGLTYEKIANMFSISKERVKQIACKNGLGDRWGKGRKYKKSLCKLISKDIRSKLSLDEILKKHPIPRQKLLYIFNYYHNSSLIADFRNRRNKKIVTDFIKGNTAQRIVNKKDKVLLDPTKITTLDNIYLINTKNGVKRFPQIGKRCAGGIFEDRKILDLIVKKYEVDNLSFRQIAEDLNKLGYKTLTGKAFEMQNTYVKYHAYKEKKNKKLYFSK